MPCRFQVASCEGYWGAGEMYLNTREERRIMKELYYRPLTPEDTETVLNLKP